MVEKPAYKLRLKDFIPLVGWMKYDTRFDDAIWKNEVNMSSPKYFSRDVGLMIYNYFVYFLPIMKAVDKGLEKLV